MRTFILLFCLALTAAACYVERGRFDASDTAPTITVPETPSTETLTPSNMVRSEKIPPVSIPPHSELRVAKTQLALHKIYEEAFVEVADSFGMSRILELRVHGPENISTVAAYKTLGLEGRVLTGLELLSVMDGGARTYVDPYKGVDMDDAAGLGKKRRATRLQVMGLDPENSGLKFKTRAPDAFEREALAKIRGGDVIHSSKNGDRLLGAIRARKRCTECHDVKEGDLMSAFSYTFRSRP
jgi:hypothetical protein